MTQNDDDLVEAEPAQPGRKRDPSRDAEILDATLEVLAEVGAARLTMDMVAARAGAGKATIYRRWTSKVELVIDAVAHMKRNQVDLEHLPTRAPSAETSSRCSSRSRSKKASAS